jgi:FkbM family methyltransferase
MVDRFDWLRALDVKTVVDGGANQGQWLAYARQIWPEAKYVCFEPQGECASMIPKDGNVTVVESALGDRIGLVKFNRSSFNQSSSILKMGVLHKEAFPFSAGETIVDVPVTTLDQWCEENGVWGDVVKLDLQGYELAALMHMPRSLMKAKVLCVETSYVELYEGQPLFGDIHDYLGQLGYRYAGCIEPPLGSPLDGRPLEEDSWWVKM